MNFDKETIASLENRFRALFINSLSGFKSANLVGTCNAEKNTNLAIFSSVVHLGSNPPLLAIIVRPHSVPRGTLENILETGYYTLNHVNDTIYERAHQTAARYPQGVSEFETVGLTEQWQDGFFAPFVKESAIRLGMQLREHHHLDINQTEMIIGEVVCIEIPDEILSEDGYVAIEQANSVAVSSLDSYHQTRLLAHLSYAKPDKMPQPVDRGDQQLCSILDSRITDMTAPQTVLVIGASGGIGQAFCQQLIEKYPDVNLIRTARNLDRLVPLAIESQDLYLDLLNDDAIAAAMQMLQDDSQIDWVVIATGWLHDEHNRPEKTFRHLQRQHLLHAYDINALGPALLIKQLCARLDKKYPTKIGVLSARVGSISDNRLGGWHSYRASKAALNMLIKNFAIEFENTYRSHLIVGLQPGTTDTPLSAPFQRGVAAEQLQTPDFTASQLIKVMQVLQPQDSGLLFDFLGLPFEP